MDELVSFTPASPTFRITLGEETVSRMTLVNVSDKTVAYKMKTTRPKRYTVRPCAAIFKPAEEIVVKIVLQPFRSGPPDIHECRDRFQLQAVALRDIPTLSENPTVAEVWEKAPADVIQGTKFSVQMELKHSPTASHEEKNPAAPDAATLPPPDLEASARSSQPTPSPVPSSALPPTPPRRNVKRTTQQTSPRTTVPSAAVSAVSSAPKSTTTKDPIVAPQSSPVASAPSTPVAPVSAQSQSTAAPQAEAQKEVDYKSVAFARSRALGVRPAPPVECPALDRSMRQRIAVERAGELVRVINVRLNDIDQVRRELAEARHKLSDAQMATRPAYDVRYEVSESARVPFAQICIMAIISGALLQLLV